MKIKLRPFKLLLLAPCFITSMASATESISMVSTGVKDMLKTKSGNIRVGMSSLQQNSDLNSAKTLSTSIGLEFNKSLNSFSDIDFKANLKLESGSTDSLLDNNVYEPNNGFGLKRAELNFRILKDLKLSIGAIDLGDYKSDLLLNGSSFLGVGQKYTYKNEGFTLKIKALQASPTTKNTTNRLDKVDEGTPSFFLEKLSLAKGDNKNNFEVNIGHFAYDNLSNSVAAQSSYYGNSVSLDSSNSGEFTYSYIGHTYGLNAKFGFGSMSFNPYFDTAINTAAPDNNRASKMGLNAQYVKNNSEYSLGFEQFETQSDAVVSYYTSNIYRSNRVGSVISSKYKNLVSFVEVEVKLAQFKEIEKNQLEYRDEEQIVYAGVSKAYEF